MESAILEYGVLGAALIACWGSLVWVVRYFIAFLVRKDLEHVKERETWLAVLEQLSAEHTEILAGMRQVNGKEP